MIYLYTDFGYEGPYVGQMKAVLARLAPEVPVIDIMHDAPVCDPKRATYLLAALAQKSEFGDVWLCVVDPGVGSERLPVVLDCGGVTFVGPNNGLFELIHRRVNGATLGQIAWQPDIMSATFHGRDLFAPVAAWTAIGEDVETAVIDPAEPRPGVDWPDDLAEIIYIDAYGNLVTGIGGSALTDDQEIAGSGPDNEICAHILRCSRRQIVLASELNGPHRDRCKSRMREPSPRSAGWRFD